MMKTNSIRPYRTNLEYLAAQLAMLDALAAWRLAGRKPGFIKRGIVETVPEGADPSRLRRAYGARRDAHLHRTRATLTVGSSELPLETLARTHGLDDTEKMILIALLGPDLDDAFERSMEALGGNHPCGNTVRSVLSLLCDSVETKIQARRYFVHNSRLLANGLINMGYSCDITSENDFMSMTLQIPRRVASLILGEYDVDDQLLAFSSVIEPEVGLDQVVLPPGQLEEVSRLVRGRAECLHYRKAWGFDEVVPYGRGLVMLFSGPPGTGKTMLAHALARDAGYRLMLVDLNKVMRCMPQRGLDDNLQRVFHEARLQHAILFFDEADEMFEDRDFNGAMPTLLRELERLDGVCILATNRRQVLDEALDRRILYKLDFEVPPPEAREQIWRRHLPDKAPLAKDIDLKVLAEEFEFSGGYIKNAVIHAMNCAVQRTGAARRIRQADLHRAAVRQRRNRLTAHADKVQPKVTLADVVVDARTRQGMEALVCAVRQRGTVFARWGFGQKSSRGKGLAALLSGPPGTGKSMSAEAIAGELGQNLYPVRMDAVISKFVGETEKNLAAVFAAARETEALVFFDEADTLFTQRQNGDGPAAHYLNQQVNVLLTELEKFDGVVLLATNRPGTIDAAFARRIRFHIRFELPDVATRAVLWRASIPTQAPLGAEVDFAELAEAFPFSGGTIRSVVLRAAFAAAGNGQVISRELLREAARAEQPLASHKASIGFGATESPYQEGRIAS